MSKTVAALTLAVAGAFTTAAANAHDHRFDHDRYYRGHDRVIVVPEYRYVAPVAPAYVEPVAPQVFCTPKFNRYGQEIGSIRQNQNPYTGELSRPYASPAPCY